MINTLATYARSRFSAIWKRAQQQQATRSLYIGQLQTTKYFPQKKKIFKKKQKIVFGWVLRLRLSLLVCPYYFICSFKCSFVICVFVFIYLDFLAVIRAQFISTYAQFFWPKFSGTSRALQIMRMGAVASMAIKWLDLPIN